MLRRSTVSLWLLLFALTQLVAQESPAAQKPHFRWSIRKAEELSEKNTIPRSSELNEMDKINLIGTIEQELRPYKSEYEIKSERELHTVASKTRIKVVDLNDDGTPEIIAQASDYKAGCGATGNCPFWVFEKSAEGFRKILDTRDKDGIGGMQFVTINDDRTKGFRDITLADSESGGENTLYLYRYDALGYRIARCYEAWWQSTDKGEWRELKIPKIVPCDSVVSNKLPKQNKTAPQKN